MRRFGRQGEQAMTEPAPIGLAVDLSTKGVAKIVPVSANGRFENTAIQSFSDVSASTLTGAFMDVERITGQSLRNMNVALAIPGVPGRTTMPVLRSRWMLSREGLDQFFGHPVTIVNDGTAKAWGALSEPGCETPVGDTPRLAPLSELGRRALIQFEAGLGAVLIDHDPTSSYMVLQTEMGHLSFAAADELDDRFVAELRGTRQPTSWESALRVAQGVQPSATFSTLSTAQKQDLMIRWAACFVSSVVLAGCAWEGAYLTGSGWSFLKQPNAAKLFMAHVRRSRVFPRQFETLSCWLVEQDEDVLRGCAQILSRSAANASPGRDGM
jgi:hypothetical protein